MLKNETKVDVEYNSRVTENMSGKKSKRIIIAASVVLLVCGVIMLLLEYAVPSDEKADPFYGILFLVLGTIFLVFVLAYRPFMKMILKKTMQGKESTIIYTFAEDGYEVITYLNDGTTSTATGSYSGFIEAKEFKDMWLLYINKATIFSVSKSGMTEGTADELSAFLSRVMGARYKMCYKR